jgi:hypothetical protein
MNLKMNHIPPSERQKLRNAEQHKIFRRFKDRSNTIQVGDYYLDSRLWRWQCVSILGDVAEDAWTNRVTWFMAVAAPVKPQEVH